jgi:hypothetical protein
LESWLPLIERLGLPTAFLIGLLVMIGWMGRAVYKAVTPFVKLAFTRWMGFIDTIESCQKQIVENQQQQSNLLSALATDGHNRAEQVEQVIETLINAAERLLPPDQKEKVTYHFERARDALKK